MKELEKQAADQVSSSEQDVQVLTDEDLEHIAGGISQDDQRWQDYKAGKFAMIDDPGTSGYYWKQRHMQADPVNQKPLRSLPGSGPIGLD